MGEGVGGRGVALGTPYCRRHGREVESGMKKRHATSSLNLMDELMRCGKDRFHSHSYHASLIER